MKNYQSRNEGTWVEIVSVQLTEAEKTLMFSTKPADADAKKVLMARLKSEREVLVGQTESENFTSLYNTKKPALKNNDTYQFISTDIYGMDGNYNGIINYRINGEHKQIRF